MDTSRRSVLAGAGAAVTTAAIPLKAGAQGSRRPAASGRKVRVLLWGPPFDLAFQQAFVRDTGVEVEFTLEESSSYVSWVFRHGPKDYDVVCTLDRDVAEFSASQLLQPLNHSLLSSVGNLDTRFVSDGLDPELATSVPLAFFVLGIAQLDSRSIPVADTTWSELFPPYDGAGAAILSHEPLEVLSIAMLQLGLDPKEPSERSLRAAGDLLKTAFQQGLRGRLTNSADRSWIQSGLQAMEFAATVNNQKLAGEPVSLFYPRDGAIVSTDTMCVPAEAPSPDLAHLFIDYVLDAEVGSRVASFHACGCPNAAARQLLPDSLRDNPLVHPPAAVMDSAIRLPGLPLGLGFSLNEVWDDALRASAQDIIR